MNSEELVTNDDTTQSTKWFGPKKDMAMAA